MGCDRLLGGRFWLYPLPMAMLMRRGKVNIINFETFSESLKYHMLLRDKLETVTYEMHVIEGNIVALKNSNSVLDTISALVLKPAQHVNICHKCVYFSEQWMTGSQSISLPGSVKVK